VSTTLANMSRSLYILRHAKAEPLAAEGGDHERVLARRGEKDAALVGRALSALDEAPELVLCSSAARARQTAELAKAEGDWRAPLALERGLFDATAETMLARLRALDAGVKRVLLVGHQPSLAQLIALLCGGEPDFPTAALARVDVAGTWSEVAAHGGRLAWLLTPEVVAALRKRR